MPKQYKKIGYQLARFSKNDPLLISTFCIENVGKYRKRDIFDRKRPKKDFGSIEFSKN